jgi:succinate dehydrogenase/fumarate reductase flavoprotein subunit
MSRRLKAVQSDSTDASPKFGILYDELKQAMTLGIGIVRTASGLVRAIAIATSIRERLAGLPVVTMGDLTASIEIEDMCMIGMACASSALHREESRAAHYREDFPNSDPASIRTVTYDKNGPALREIARDPDEETWDGLRLAATKPLTQSSEREHVE